MNFNSIKKYWNFDGYNRIKIIKSKQKTNQKSSKTNAKTYDDYLDKISGFQCCCKEEVCNCCCTYSLNGCCKKETTQTFTTGSTDCICFTGMMEARSGMGPYEHEGPSAANGIGYNDISGQTGAPPPPLQPFGSLNPKKTCEGLLIASITYITGATLHKPNIQVTFSGDTWGGTFFKCILLRNGKTVIKLYRDDIHIIQGLTNNPQVWSTTEPQGGPFTTYFWRIPTAAIIEGKWCVQISM